MRGMDMNRFTEEWKKIQSNIKHKLKSNDGASIAMALLLFLVCMVLGSIVLAAGSAAAGRMTGLQDSEQKKYGVLSAADVLRKEVAETESILTVSSTTTREQSRAYDSSVQENEVTGDDEYVYTVVGEGGWSNSGEATTNVTVTPQKLTSLLDRAAYVYMQIEKGKIVPGTATPYFNTNTDASGKYYYTTFYTGLYDNSGTAVDGTKVSVEMRLYAEGDHLGNMRFILTTVSDDPAAAVLSATVDCSVNLIEVDSSHDDVSYDDSMKTKTTVTTTESECTVSWIPEEIKW